ncbi:MAG: hypothetical protein HC888_04050 [Candidatus Competibacteraceae bacterium]|nr:hypothetical protein [Candidatus Competibacteraceae bacterium]
MGVIYRPHPWGNGGKDGGRILSQHWSNIRIESSMRPYLERVQQGDLSKHLPDYETTRDVMAAADAVVSPLSTILIEAMMLGKAPMCFMPVEEADAGHFKLAEGQVHFDEFLASDELTVAWGGEALVPGLSRLFHRIAEPSFADALKHRSEFFVSRFEEPFRARIVNYLATVVENRSC